MDFQILNTPKRGRSKYFRYLQGTGTDSNYTRTDSIASSNADTVDMLNSTVNTLTTQLTTLYNEVEILRTQLLPTLEPTVEPAVIDGGEPVSD